MTAQSLVAGPETPVRDAENATPTGGAAAGPRRVATTLGSAATSLLSSAVRRPSETALRGHAGQTVAGRIKEFTTTLADDPAGASPEVLVDCAARVVDADMAVLTIVDPHSD